MKRETYVLLGGLVFLYFFCVGVAFGQGSTFAEPAPEAFATGPANDLPEPGPGYDPKAPRPYCCPSRVALIFTDGTEAGRVAEASFNRAYAERSFSAGSNTRGTVSNHNQIRHFRVNTESGRRVAERWGVTVFPSVVLLDGVNETGGRIVYRSPAVTTTARRRHEDIVGNVVRFVEAGER